MILGSVHVSEKAVTTHRDSYLLGSISVVSVRRPFFGGAILIAFGLTVFTLAFGDLLYVGEIISFAMAIALIVFAGAQIGQLKLLSRDLRGSDLSDAIWGQCSHLNMIRREIVGMRQSLKKGEAA